MATFENEDLLLQQETAAKNGFNLTPYGTGGNENAMLLTGGGNYLVDCITEESGNEFSASGSLSGQWGNPNNPSQKTLQVEVWNTLTTIEYRFILSSDGQNGGNLQYYDENLGDWVNEGSLVIGSTFSVSRDLPIGWTAGEVITEQWRNTGGGGSPLEAGDVAYTLIGECVDCDESFSYVDNGDDQAYVFTYIPADDMTNVLVEFTFAQGVAVSGLEGFTRNGNQLDPKSSVWSATLSFDACTEYTYTVDLTQNCSGNSGNSNVWTDFKVDGASKKGILDNITESCPS
jgi:hypothetical protein